MLISVILEKAMWLGVFYHLVTLVSLTSDFVPMAMYTGRWYWSQPFDVRYFTATQTTNQSSRPISMQTAHGNAKGTKKEGFPCFAHGRFCAYVQRWEVGRQEIFSPSLGKGRECREWPYRNHFQRNWIPANKYRGKNWLSDSHNSSNVAWTTRSSRS